ncbi:hypothetical protein ZWY2020_035925 [Hordeum vulgare]|nr:hypothetical protein ZWY2020_035925 [Hordeum vulgare]
MEVLRHRRATATPTRTLRTIQLTPVTAPAPGDAVDGARLLGLSPHTTSSSRSSSIDLCNTRMTTTTSSSSRSCRGRDENTEFIRVSGAGYQRRGRRTDRIKSFEQELDAFQRVKRELFSDVPYFLIIDNLESERDWWEGKDLQDFIPRNTTFSLLSSTGL